MISGFKEELIVKQGIKEVGSSIAKLILIVLTFRISNLVKLILIELTFSLL